MKYSIVIPCYNEEKNIVPLLERFSQAIENSDMLGDIEVILVDNGSTDDSATKIKEFLPQYAFAETVRVEKNQGYGFGILQGLSAARGDFIGWTHADLQTDPQDVIKAFSLANEQTFVKGNRKKRPLSDQVFTFGMSVFESIYMGTALWDINAQPNIFPRSFFQTWKNPPHDFSLDLYALYMARAAALELVRFDVLFPPRIHGASSWNTGLSAKWKFIKRTLRFSFELKKGGIQ